MQDIAVSDAELIQQAARGDPEAFTALFDRHYTQVFQHTVALCGDTDLAEDITQMAFLRAHRSLNKFGPPWLIRPWLYRVVRNLLVDTHRRQDPADRLDTDAPIPGDEPEPEGHLVSAEVSGQVERTLLALSTQQRQALVMREIDGFSYQDIASVLGISLDNVKVVLHRARASFKESYGVRLLAEDSLGDCEELAELLDAYHDEELSSEQDRIVRDHLRSCERCQQRKRRIAAMALLMTGIKLPQPPPALRGHILDLARGGASASGAHAPGGRGGGEPTPGTPPEGGRGGGADLPPGPEPEPPMIMPAVAPEPGDGRGGGGPLRLALIILLGIAVAFVIWLLLPALTPDSSTSAPTPTISAAAPPRTTAEPTASASEETPALPASGCECRGQDLYCADGTIGLFNPQCTGSGGKTCSCVCDQTDQNNKCIKGHDSCNPQVFCLP